MGMGFGSMEIGPVERECWGLDTGLLDALSEMEDPRKPGEMRRPLPAVPALPVCAMLSGTKSLDAIAQWGREHSRLPGPLDSAGIAPLVWPPCITCSTKDHGDGAAWRENGTPTSPERQRERYPRDHEPGRRANPTASGPQGSGPSKRGSDGENSRAARRRGTSWILPYARGRLIPRAVMWRWGRFPRTRGARPYNFMRHRPSTTPVNGHNRSGNGLIEPVKNCPTPGVLQHHLEITVLRALHRPDDPVGLFRPGDQLIPNRRSQSPGGRIHSGSNPDHGRSCHRSSRTRWRTGRDRGAGAGSGQHASETGSRVRNARPHWHERHRAPHVRSARRRAVLPIGNRRPPAVTDADEQPGARAAAERDALAGCLEHETLLKISLKGFTDQTRPDR